MWSVVKGRRQRRRDVHLGSTWTLGKVIRGNVKRDARRTKTHWCRVVVFGGSHGGTPNSVARLRHVFGVSSLAHHECHFHEPSKFFCMWYDPPLVLVSVDSPSLPPKSSTPTVKTRAQHAETQDRNASAIRRTRHQHEETPSSRPTTNTCTQTIANSSSCSFRIAVVAATRFPHIHVKRLQRTRNLFSESSTKLVGHVVPRPQRIPPALSSSMHNPRSCT